MAYVFRFSSVVDARSADVNQPVAICPDLGNLFSLFLGAGYFTHVAHFLSPFEYSQVFLPVLRFNKGQPRKQEYQPSLRTCQSWNPKKQRIRPIIFSFLKEGGSTGLKVLPPGQRAAHAASETYSALNLAFAFSAIIRRP